MGKYKFVNLTVFIIFFGTALFEAFQKQNWIEAIIFLALGVLSLWLILKEKLEIKKNMATYKHTQIGYLMLVITLVVLVFFAWLQITARAEPPSIDSGTNFAVTAIMALILSILASFGSLTVSVDEQHVAIKFGYGIFRKKFSASEIASATQVKNHWYYGWGIRLWFWPRMWIYNVSCFDAVEIRMKNGKIYRIGTDEPEKLETAIKRVIFA